MLGAIMGDICGSPWEGGACRDDTFEFFAPSSGFTDDTVCTVAVAQALLTGAPLEGVLRDWCKRYPGVGYGGQFSTWVYRASMGPYNSWGNGGAMRCSACGWLATSLDEAEALAEQTAGITHNHPDGLRGARAVAGAIWLARQGMGPAILGSLLRQRYGYPLGLSAQERAAMNPGGTDAADTVPLALDCALQSSSVEDAIRKAIYIGGDSDTTANMAGAIAEARFGLSDALVQRTLSEIPEEMHPIIFEVYARSGTAISPTVPPVPPGVGATARARRLAATMSRRRGLSAVWTWLRR